MVIVVRLDGYLKQYNKGKKVVELVIEDEKVTLVCLKELLNIPKNLGIAAVSEGHVVPHDFILKGEKIEIMLIPPMNGG